MTLSIECHYAECPNYLNVMLSDIVLNVVVSLRVPHAQNDDTEHNGIQHNSITKLRITKHSTVTTRITIKNATSGKPTLYAECRNGTAYFENINSCWNFYLETPDGQNSHLYLNVVDYFNTSVNEIARIY
jgi:hypothetical protein